MKILCVTGILGFIGSHFAKRALELGYFVYGIDKNTQVSDEFALHELQGHSKFQYVEEDIKDIKFIPDCDFVVNFAAESHVANSIVDSDNFMNSNVLGVQNLLELVRQKHNNVTDRPIFLQVSTDEVYGDIEKGYHKETDMLNPSNPYAASKASADLLVLAWARTYGIQYNIVRPTNNYGQNQYPEKLIPLSVKNLRRGRQIKLHNHGTPIRTWLHVEDTTDAILTVINKGQRNEIYNISGGYELANIDTVKMIIVNYFDKQGIWQDYVDFSCKRQGQDVRYALDDSKIRALGWKPIRDFEIELEKIIRRERSTFRW